MHNASANTIAGNLVGRDINGMAAVPNGHNDTSGNGAIHLEVGSSLNVIGTNGDGQNDELERNIISGNSVTGETLMVRIQITML